MSAAITTFSEFVPHDPRDGPPVAPFQWRVVNRGAVDFEFLFDARGRQIFNRSSAVIRKAGTTDILRPEQAEDDGEVRA